MAYEINVSCHSCIMRRHHYRWRGIVDRYRLTFCSHYSNVQCAIEKPHYEVATSFSIATGRGRQQQQRFADSGAIRKPQTIRITSMLLFWYANELCSTSCRYQSMVKSPFWKVCIMQNFDCHRAGVFWSKQNTCFRLSWDKRPQNHHLRCENGFVVLKIFFHKKVWKIVKVNYCYRAKLLICDEFPSSSNKVAAWYSQISFEICLRRMLNRQPERNHRKSTELHNWKAFSLCFIITTNDCATRSCRFMFTEMSLSLDTLSAGGNAMPFVSTAPKNSGR